MDSPSAELTLPEQAARWLLELEAPGPRTLDDFAAWLKTSPAHIEEFLLASSIWQALDHLDAERRIQIERLLAQTLER